MERKGRCKKAKVVFMKIIKFQGFMITTLSGAFDQKGFSRLVLISNSWNVLQLKYKTIGFACFSRRLNYAVSEKPRWT